jgi:predicted nucleic acid-binding Zn ribbon protein
MTADRVCPVCAKPLPARRTRPFVYCSHRCQQRAFDIRKRPDRLAQRLAVAQAAVEELDARIRDEAR